MTIGIVVLAFLATTDACVTTATMMCNQRGGERAEPVELSVGEAVFDDDVFPFYIAEFA
jgi:hypothetical protein